MNVNLQLKKEIFNPALFQLLFDYSHRWEFLMGGAGSGKSYFITQKLILRCLNEKIRVLVCRKTATSVRESCFSLFKEVIDKWQLTPYCKINKSDYKISFPNQSEIIFLGLDTETRILSLNNIGTIFVEEAFEVERSFIDQLNLRMRGKNQGQQIILAWNPISKDSYLYDLAVQNPPPNSIFIKTTYKDNPFLPLSYIEAIESYKYRDANKWRIYGQGEWGIDPEGLVFTNWVQEDFAVAEVAQKFERRTGSDLGFIDPSTIIDTFYDKASSTIYVFQEYYAKGVQLSDMASSMRKMELRKQKIYMDSAEPRSIDYFRREGFNAVPCLKGQGSVEARIKFLQNNKLIIHSSCSNLIRELSNFSYIKNKNTGNYSDKMTHEYSHCIDALGYAYSDIYMNNKLKTYSKSMFGL